MECWDRISLSCVDPEHPMFTCSMSNRSGEYAAHARKEWNVLSFLEMWSDPHNMGQCIVMRAADDVIMGLGILSQNFVCTSSCMIQEYIIRFIDVCFKQYVSFFNIFHITTTLKARHWQQTVVGSFGFYWRIKQLYIYLPFLALIFLR